MKTNVDLLIGPYVGNWEHEIITFRPYARWLHNVLGNNRDVYISTHINRRFLYDWISDDMFIPIYETLSRDETHQYKSIHKDLNAKDFNILTKDIKNTLITRQHSKNKIKSYSLNYTVNAIVNCPIHNKIFEPINIDDNKGEYIAFIPDNRTSEKQLSVIYKHLTDKHDNVIIIGDMCTYLKDDNIMLDCVDYFENGYVYIMEYISGANAVICPSSHWTAIANMQGVPVFSWGEVVNQYRDGGIYNFNNDNCIAITTDNNTPINIITDMIDYFIDRTIKTGGKC